jgi:type II secretory pathway pseudopilin PulG
MKRGMTLVECLVTMFLLMIVLGAALELVRSYSGVLRYSSSKDRTLQAALVALEQIRTELAQGHQLISPPGPASVPHLEFRKLSPARTLPLPPDSAPPGWTPHPASDEVLVRYEVTSDTLRREVVRPSGSTTSLALASSITGLSTRLVPNGNVEVVLSIREDKQVRALTTEVFLLWLR